MTESDSYAEMQQYTDELKRLLAAGDLSPDTRAKCLAALIEADAMTRAARRMHMAGQTLLHDTYPVVKSTLGVFSENMQNLTRALESFREPADRLAAGLRRLPPQ